MAKHVTAHERRGNTDTEMEPKNGEKHGRNFTWFYISYL